jgi:nucleotide-binding universal stress UspA family protein
MGIFHTILHPTDFDTCSLEAFRVSRDLAHQLGTKVVAFHVVSPPAVVMDDGRVIMDPKIPTPVDIWTDYRAAHTDFPDVSVEYSVVVGKHNEATRMLVDLIGENANGVLLVIGTHGRTGLSRLIWGNRSEEVVRTAPCAVLVVKEPT